MPKGATLKHKHNGIFPARTAPAPTILSRKDGARRSPLAYLQFIDKLFSIPAFAAASRRSDQASPLSLECGGRATLAHCGYAESGGDQTILTAHGASLEGLCRRKLPCTKPPDARRESRPAALPCFPRLPTTTPCVRPAEPARYPPPNRTIVGCFRASWRDIPLSCCRRPSTGGKCARRDVRKDLRRSRV